MGDNECQTLSMKKLFEEYDIQKRIRLDEKRKKQFQQFKRQENLRKVQEETRKRQVDEERWKIEESRKKDLKQLFESNAELKDMLAQEPKGADERALEKWRSLGPLTVDFILQNSSIDDLKVEAKDLEFKHVDFGKYYHIGYFKKGTDIRHGICREVYKNGFIIEGMIKNNSWTKYQRNIWSDSKISEMK